MEKELLYQRISEDLRQRISDGALKAGDAIPTVRELMAHYSVSHKSVLRAYQDLKERGAIIQRGRGYVVRLPEEAKVRNENFRIGMLIRPLWKSNLADIFFNDIVYGIQSECCAAKIDLSIPASVGLLDRESQLQERYFQEIEWDADRLSHTVDGFLLDERLPDFVIDRILKKNNKPGVIVNRATSLPDIPCVVQNNRKALFMLFSAAQGIGCEQFIFVVSNIQMHNIQERLSMIKDFVKEFHLPPECCHFVGEHGNMRHQELMDAVVNKVREVRSQGKTILMASSDGLARISLNELKKYGILPNSDLAVTGIDGVGYALNFSPVLTTVDVMPMEMGRMAVSLLLRRQMYPQQYIPKENSPEPHFIWGETLCHEKI